jgi:hypothetical protein
MSPVPTISRARPGTFLLLIALAAGIGHRLYLAVATDFPINDGALSYAFIKKAHQEIEWVNLGNFRARGACR